MSRWAALESDIVSCTRCPRLVAWREEVARVKRRAYRDDVYWGRPVPGFGDRLARVLVVGLAPGAHGANRTGRLFTGDSSGDFLYSALHRAGFASQPISRGRDDGLTLHDLYISAACRCVPPDNRPAPDELAACRPFLAQEIALLSDLRIIVALGRIAFETVLRAYGVHRSGFPNDPDSRAPAFSHASVHRLGAGLPTLIASFHPSRQNTQTGRLTVTMFDAVWAAVRVQLASHQRASGTPSDCVPGATCGGGV